VAAALIMKGVSPGAALVFLLVGPATNVATMTTVGRFLGKRSLLIYLAAMVGTSLLLGMGLDAVAGERISDKVVDIGQHHGASTWIQVVMWICAVLFLALLANGVRLRLVPCWLAWRDRLGRGRAPKPAAAAAAAADACCAGSGGTEADDGPQRPPEPAAKPSGGACCASEECESGSAMNPPEPDGAEGGADASVSEADRADSGDETDSGAEGEEGPCPHCGPG